MTKRDIQQSDLEEFFIIDNEEDFNFLHDIGNECYEWKQGIDGAEIFSRDELKETLNHPENDGIDVSVISVGDAFNIVGVSAEEIEITEIIK